MDLSVGDKVILTAPLPYLKTADPMPMLRPPDLVMPDESGQIIEIRPKGVAAVRFRRGTFLVSLDRLEIASSLEGGSD